MHYERKRVAHIAVDEQVEPHQVALLVSVRLVIERGVAACAGLQAVEEVVYYLVERQAVRQLHARRVDVGHIDENSALVLTQFHNLPHIFRRSVNHCFDHRFLYAFDFRGRGQIGGIVHNEFFAVCLGDVIRHPGRGGDEVEVKLALESFLDNLHMQQPEKTATESETERLAVFGFERQRSVVELQFQQGFLEVVVFGSVGGVNTRIDHWSCFFVSFKWRIRRSVRSGNRIADSGICDVFHARRDITDLAGRQCGDGFHTRRVHADFHHFEHFSGGAHLDAVARFHGPVHNAHH